MMSKIAGLRYGYDTLKAAGEKECFNEAVC